MRTIVPAATAAQLQSFYRCFDVVGGASAGTVAGLYYLTRRVRFYRLLFRDGWLKRFINPWNLFRLRPIIQTEQLLSALDSRINFDYSDLEPLDTTMAGAVLGLRNRSIHWHEFNSGSEYNDCYRLAGCSLPLISGTPLKVNGRRYLDAGYRQPLPFRSFIREYDLTHLLVLPSRSYHDRACSLSWFEMLVLLPYLRFMYPALADLYRERPERYNRCIGALMDWAQENSAPHVLPLYAEGFPTLLAKTTTDRGILRQGASAGQTTGEMYRNMIQSGRSTT